MIDLNEWVEDRVKEDITVAYGISSENKNGRRVINCCVERALYLVIYISSISKIHKYTRVVRVREYWKIRACRI